MGTVIQYGSVIQVGASPCQRRHTDGDCHPVRKCHTSRCFILST